MRLKIVKERRKKNCDNETDSISLCRYLSSQMKTALLWTQKVCLTKIQQQKSRRQKQRAMLKVTKTCSFLSLFCFHRMKNETLKKTPQQVTTLSISLN